MRNRLLKKTTSYFSTIILVLPMLVFSQNKKPGSVLKEFPMAQMIALEKSIKEPKFKNTVYDIKDFGAVADGKTLNTKSINDAIKVCAQKGGGKVIIPAGKYLTGPIHLLSNVNLHVEEGAEVLFSTNTKDYYPLVKTSFEGTELMNYSPLIYAYQQKNIAITGKGTLNGQGSNENWWPWKGQSAYGYVKGTPSQLDAPNVPGLVTMGAQGIPAEKRVFGDGFYLRPNFIEPNECENVLIQGVKIINAPFWVIHPMKSKNIIIDGVHIKSHGPNNDGCDPEYSKNIVIKNCIFDTGDDCIAIKAGKNADGRRNAIVTENIIIRDCKMIDGHGGVVIGSEMSAGVKNVFAYNCEMDSPELDRAIRVKTNIQRGGYVDGLYVKNIKVGQVKEAVVRLNMNYNTEGTIAEPVFPKIKNIFIEDVTVENGGKYVVFADGLPESKIDNVVLKNVKIKQVKENFNLKNITNLKLIDVTINGQKVNSPK